MYDSDLEDEQVMTLREFEVEPPQSSISPDEEWVTVVMTKFGFNVEEVIGTRKVTFWESFNIPYGNELKVALPLVDNPTEKQPENTITPAKIARAVYEAKQVDSMVKKLEEENNA